MTGFVRKAMAPGVTAVSSVSFNLNLEEDEVVFLLLHSGSDSRVVDIVSAASQSLLGEPRIYASTSRTLYTQYGLPSPTTGTVPVLLAIKGHNPRSYAAKLELDGLATGTGSSDGLEKWLLRNRFPIVGKLGMDNFYSVMKVRDLSCFRMLPLTFVTSRTLHDHSLYSLLLTLEHPRMKARTRRRHQTTTKAIQQRDMPPRSSCLHTQRKAYAACTPSRLHGPQAASRAIKSAKPCLCGWMAGNGESGSRTCMA